MPPNARKAIHIQAGRRFRVAPGFAKYTVLPYMVVSFSFTGENRSLWDELQPLLRDLPRFVCSGYFRSGEELLRNLRLGPPQVAIIEQKLPGMTGLECTRQLKRSLPEIEVIVLADEGDADSIFGALKAGADGFLWNNTRPQDLLEAVLELRNGGLPLARAAARRLAKHFRPPPTPRVLDPHLSRREEEILNCLAQGFATKEIAAQLSVSYDTIRTHLKHIYGKLNVRSRTEAVIKRLNETRP